MKIKNATFLNISEQPSPRSGAIDGKDDDRAYFNVRAAYLKFDDCLPTAYYSAGFLPNREGRFIQVDRSIGDNDKWLGFFNIQIESKILPGAVIKQEADKLIKEYHAENGEWPTRKMKQQMREDIEANLLIKAFTKKTQVMAAIVYDENRLIVFSTNSGEIRLVTALLQRLYEQRIKFDLMPAMEFLPWQLAMLSDIRINLAVANKIQLRIETPRKMAIGLEVEGGGLSEELLKEYFQKGYRIRGVDLTDGDDAYSFHITNTMQLKSIRFSSDILLEAQGEQNEDTKEMSMRANRSLQTVMINRIFNNLLTLTKATEIKA